MTETKIIERLRRHVEEGFTPNHSDVYVLLAEYDRLTTPQDPSAHKAGEMVLAWYSGYPYCVAANICPDEQWTPLPTPKEAPCETA